MQIFYGLESLKGEFGFNSAVCGCRNIIKVLLLSLLITNLALANDIQTPDMEGNVGRFTSLALDANGNPVISYYDLTNHSIKLLHCGDSDCSGDDKLDVHTLGSKGHVGTYTSVLLDKAGDPVVSYYDSFNGVLKILRCKGFNCSSNGVVVTNPGNISGMYSSLALDDNGNPVVSFYDDTNGDLRILHCYDYRCKENESRRVSTPDSSGDVGLYTSLALDDAGNPVVSYYASGKGLRVLHCNDPDCKKIDSSNISSPDIGEVGWYSSLKLDSDGNPVISYYDFSGGRLKVLHCDDPKCAGDESKNIAVPDAASNVGAYLSMALDVKGNPVISYYDSSNGDLKLLHCDDPSCSGDEMGNITVPAGVGDVGLYTSVALDSAGNPVVSYYDFTNGDLKLLHCGNSKCIGNRQH